MISGKVVAVTGASSGIGEATAEYLARRGAKLVLGARGADKLEEVRRRIIDAGGEAESVAIDVARRELWRCWSRADWNGSGDSTCSSTMPASCRSATSMILRLTIGSEWSTST